MVSLAFGLSMNPGNRPGQLWLGTCSLKSEQLGTPRGCARKVDVVTNIGGPGKRSRANGIHSPIVHQTSL